MANNLNHILVIRLSALGDVAMTIPVIASLLKKYPDLHLTFLSRKFAEPLLGGLTRVRFLEADVYGKHRGAGLIQLANEARGFNIDAVADLHNVIRSRVITAYLKIRGYPIQTIDKGRTEKATLTRAENKVFKPVRSTIGRYCDVFTGLGFPIAENELQPLPREDMGPRILKLFSSPMLKGIGIAPFAAYKSKAYPIELMEEILARLDQEGTFQVFLFGGGADEIKVLDRLAGEIADKAKTLRAGHEFDEVVLAIAIGALPYIASDIIEVRADTWGKMIKGVKSIPTQAFQVWFDKSLPEMGFDSKLYGTDRLVGANFNLATTDFTDFSDLIEWEGWEDGDVPAPRGLLYFCGPMQDLTVTPPFTDTDYPRRAYDRVKWTAANYLRTFAGPILPDAAASAIDAQGLDFNLLHNVHPDIPDEGINRISQQYIRPNIDPSERYVTSLPGSAAHRLRAWDSGIDNLVLCGDWTYTGINVGSFEGSVMGGMLASYALTGSPTLAQIDAYTFLHPNETGAPPRLKDA